MLCSGLGGGRWRRGAGQGTSAPTWAPLHPAFSSSPGEARHTPRVGLVLQGLSFLWGQTSQGPIIRRKRSDLNVLQCLPGWPAGASLHWPFHTH